MVGLLAGRSQHCSQTLGGGGEGRHRGPENTGAGAHPGQMQLGFESSGGDPGAWERTVQGLPSLAHPRICRCPGVWEPKATVVPEREGV